MVNDARKRYTYTTAEELLAAPDKILEVIAHFEEHQLPRMERLAAYSRAENVEVLETQRRSETDMADIRTPHDFGGYIATFMTGYLAGNPIQIRYDDKIDQSPVDLAIESVDTTNNAKAHNAMIVRDATIYGRAFEIVFRGEEVTKYKKLSPLNTIMIYDMRIERTRIAALRFYDNELLEKRFIEFYDEKQKILYEVDGEALREVETEPHFFGEVPIHELENNEDRMGDFEKVIPQIDLYDFAQSDTANYMQDFNDAILGIFGDIDLGNVSPDEKIEMMKKMRQARLMHLKPPKNMDGKEGNISAEYLVKNYDVAGTEAYKTRIQSDIHKFTFTPDLLDENFAGVQSGEALKYKLFGLEVLGTTKETLLRQFLQERYSLIFSVGEILQQNGQFDPTLLQVTIVPKLPHSLEEAIKNFESLGGEMSNETKLRITGIVEDAAEEQTRVDNSINDERNLLDTQLNPTPVVEEEEADLDG